MLKNNATRPNVKKVLESWIQKCENEKKSIEKILEAQLPKKIEKKEEEKTAESSAESPVDTALKAIDNI